MPDFDPLSEGLITTIVAISFVVPVLIAVLIVGTIVWAIRRNARPVEDPAVAELRSRFALGDIDAAEFQARLDELSKGR